jgi:pantothenate kinase
MRPTQYGSVEYYADDFSDFLADVDSENPATAENLIKGFCQALDSWFEYHDEQARTYADIRKRVRQALTV